MRSTEQALPSARALRRRKGSNVVEAHPAPVHPEEAPRRVREPSLARKLRWAIVLASAGSLASALVALRLSTIGVPAQIPLAVAGSTLAAWLVARRLERGLAVPL